mmetsp:Transcript_99617/g.277359  ORF Transcript_99617/g.277359 Transcript_99617/m.277359 type:complete len:386 (+) Transcript_99617:3-1160(+)
MFSGSSLFRCCRPAMAPMHPPARVALVIGAAFLGGWPSGHEGMGRPKRRTQLACAVEPLPRRSCIARAAARRRTVVGAPLVVGAIVGTRPVGALEAPPDVGATFRTLRAPPEIPVATAVILLRTTLEAIKDWGGALSNPGKYQVSFNKRRAESFESFRTRYQNYDLTGLLNQTLLQVKDPRTNRFYFSFLNEVQWRTLGQQLTRKADAERFSRVVGDRLYRKILSGDVVGPRTIGEGDDAQVNMSSPFSGTWPPLAAPLPRGQGPADLAKGAQLLLEYLRTQGYCREFLLSEFTPDKAGVVTFTSLVREPANIEATSALMRSAASCIPRFDQRILQAYFADCGFECDFTDVLADDMDARSNPRTGLQPRGIRTVWKLRSDPDAGL